MSRRSAVHSVQPDDPAFAVGDEALLLRRRAEVPVFVGRDRRAAAVALLAAHPEVDLVLSDDGLQHLRLPRALEIVVVDNRGVGNGQLLPAGPLREPWPRLHSPPHAAPRVTLHSDAGAAEPRLERQLGDAWPLAEWWQRRPGAAVALHTLCGRSLAALAGIATPEKFFGMLEAAGLTIRRLPMPDHAHYASPPWPAGTPELVTTEKDAVKLPADWATPDPAAADAGGRPRVWVLPLDSFVSDAWVLDLLARHGPTARRADAPAH